MVRLVTFKAPLRRLVSMIRFFKWAFSLSLAGLVLAFLFLIIALQEGRCDKLGNVEKPDCVIDD